jgi:hypothetical protein
MSTPFDENIENVFGTLPADEKRTIISHGAAIYLSDLKKRLFLAQAKINHFEKQYGLSLTRLEEKGLPINADFQMHEDYVMWNHWTDTYEKLKKRIALLEKLTLSGLFQGEAINDSD